MNYKTVMVSLALDRPNDACLAVAGDIAERFGAQVIGIAASDIRPPLYFADGGHAQKLFDDEAIAIRKRLSELEVEFRTSVQKRCEICGMALHPDAAGARYLATCEARRPPRGRGAQRDLRRPLRRCGSQ